MYIEKKANTKIALVLIFIGLILMITETWYFGWNMEALSTQELMADSICSFLICIGVLNFLSIQIGKKDIK